MRKPITLFLILLLALPALCAVPVTGNLKDIATGAVTSGAFVRFELVNCMNPKQLGDSVLIGTVKDFKPDATGAISGSIVPVDEISCDNGASPAYQVKRYRGSSQVGTTVTYCITGAFDLNNPPGPCVVVPSSNTATLTGGITSDYVDTKLDAMVHKTGDETIAGNKSFSDKLSVNVTTPAGSSPLSVGSFLLTVTNPSVFGYNGLYASCINSAPGAMCYAASTMAIDATGNADYAHTVGLNPQVKQSQTKSPSGSSSDYYGVAAGFELGEGVWPGSGMRVEGPVGEGTDGQISVAYDMTDGISPTVLYARPGCRTATCNSAQIVMQGKSSGTLTSPSTIFSDFSGNVRFRTPAMFIFDAMNGADATASANVNSSSIALTANGWDGTKSTSYTWQILHNVNALGTLNASQLVFQPPSNLPVGVTPQVVLSGSDVSANAVSATSVSATGEVVAGSGVKPSSSSDAITFNKKATRTVDIASVANAACSTTYTQAVTGAQMGDSCIASAGIALESGTILGCRVTAADTITFQLCNLSGVAVDRANDTYTFRVIR